jgi:hypothetical protein
MNRMIHEQSKSESKQRPFLLFYLHLLHEVHRPSFLQRFLSSCPTATFKSYVKENSIAIDLLNRKLGFHSSHLSCCMVLLLKCSSVDGSRRRWSGLRRVRHSKISAFGQKRNNNGLTKLYLSAFLYTYSICSLVIRDEYVLKAFQNKILGIIGEEMTRGLRETWESYTIFICHLIRIRQMKVDEIWTTCSNHGGHKEVYIKYFGHKSWGKN